MASDFTTEVDRLADSLKNVLLMLNARPAAAAVPSRTSQPVETAGLPDAVADRLAALERTVAEVRQIVTGQHTGKAWYTTGELAEMLGRSQFTIQERWCNDGRIECEKDPDTGKWRIPGHEVERKAGTTNDADTGPVRQGHRLHQHRRWTKVTKRVHVDLPTADSCFSSIFKSRC